MDWKKASGVRIEIQLNPTYENVKCSSCAPTLYVYGILLVRNLIPEIANTIYLAFINKFSIKEFGMSFESQSKYIVIIRDSNIPYLKSHFSLYLSGETEMEKTARL